jgi:predicted regulator of Ras-like GTPase activity (Roadblock/LC7/MglB family)
MSLEIILIPMAIALITAANTKAKSNLGADSPNQVAVETRMKNQALLEKAMSKISCSPISDENVITGNYNSVFFTFKRNVEGIWAASFVAGTSLEVATEIISKIDKAYGLEVQAEVLRKIKERAPQAAMSLESETLNEDSSVTLLLVVNTDGY